MSLAQTNQKGTDTVPEVKKKTTLTLAAIYNTNADYYGQTADKKLPYVLANATLSFPFKLSFSISSYKLLDSTKGVTATILGLGYDFSLAKNLNAGLNYSHTFNATNSPLLQAANTDNASANINYKYWLTTGLTLDFAFGDEQDNFLTFSSSKEIDLGSFTDKDVISLEPRIEIVGGTQHFYQSYTTTQRERGRILGGIFQKPKVTTATTTVATTKFNLLSYNFSLPLSYNRSNYMIEATYKLSILGKKVETVSRTPNSFFNLGFYYQF
ncbi:MAG: hypothetical protein H7202_06565 [Pedobacter sp.]|nr:hypothetical protein [Pedobacter sp.]